MKVKKKEFLVMLFWLCGATATEAGTVEGIVTDTTDNQGLIGAVVSAGSRATATDIDGHFSIELPAGEYRFEVSYVGYKSQAKEAVSVPATGTIAINFALSPDIEQLGEVTVTAVARRDTEVAQIQSQRQSLVVQSGISARQIERSQDKNASEVIRRVPGVSIIDERFIIVRGLSQRYNNVWLNGGAVPSSEADTRAFSFDIIPAQQVDNIVIVKSPAPEYPADFTGGFVLVNTKQQPTDTGLKLSIGVGYNDKTHFRNFLSSEGYTADIFGFGAGCRSLDVGMTGRLNTYPGYSERIDVLNNGLNNNWHIHSIKPIGDLKVNAGYDHTWSDVNGATLGLLAALNYSNTYKALTDMENSLYGPYDTTNNKEVALRRAIDNQYSNNVNLGAMLNMFLRPRDSRHYFEWKNLFNLTTVDRYSDRVGFNAQPDNINTMEYYYSSRATFNTQFTGRHSFDTSDLDWNVGYAYANRELPDRRLIERTDRTNQTMGIYRISREFTKLDEHIGSAGANYRLNIPVATLETKLRTGAYGEYRTRRYRTRQFQYGWQPENTLPTGFLFDPNVADNVLIDSNYGPDKLYMYEEVNYLNNYEGNQTLIAGYAGWEIPVNAFDFYVGVRYEYNRQELKLNTVQYEESLRSTIYTGSDLFPSANVCYHIDDKQQLRAAYGRSINRPEFRELSPSVYYDFELGSNVMGNYDLQPAHIDNVDLRYEIYPSTGELLSVALFYKHFSNPIEWTYTVAGGTDLIYSFVNARGADNVGVEVDVRKNLDFIGLRDFSVSFNGALINSKVRFDGTGNNIDRPMQGQSPYIVNLGIFYNNADNGWSASALYNRIGKRIIGVGNRYGTGADGSSRNIPSSYEMPRNAIDLSVGKKIGKWELRFAVRDLLAERYTFKQFEDVVLNGNKTTIEETTRSWRPGRTFNLTVSYSF